MRFAEIQSRVTGFGIPIFGLSWNPPEAEVTAAKRAIAFLEDRRVLYNPRGLENGRHCVDSIMQMRQFLTDELGRRPDGALADSLRAMRSACRRFLAMVGDEDGEILRGEAHCSSQAIQVFDSTLGALRATCGMHIAALAVRYGLDVEDDPAAILPAEDADEEDGQARVPGRVKPAKLRG